MNQPDIIMVFEPSKGMYWPWKHIGGCAYLPLPVIYVPVGPPRVIPTVLPSVSPTVVQDESQPKQADEEEVKKGAVEKNRKASSKEGMIQIETIIEEDPSELDEGDMIKAPKMAKDQRKLSDISDSSQMTRDKDEGIGLSLESLAVKDHEEAEKSVPLAENKEYRDLSDLMKSVRFKLTRKKKTASIVDDIVSLIDKDEAAHKASNLMADLTTTLLGIMMERKKGRAIDLAEFLGIWRRIIDGDWTMQLECIGAIFDFSSTVATGRMHLNNVLEWLYCGEVLSTAALIAWKGEMVKSGENWVVRCRLLSDIAYRILL